MLVKLLLVYVSSCLVYTMGTEIKEITRDVTKPSGGEVEFSCVFDNPDENHTLLWSKVSGNRPEFVLAVNESVTIPSTKLTVKYDRRTSNYTLKIKDLDPSDVGFYRCIIPLGENHQLSGEVRLDIEQSPRIIKVTRSSESIDERQSMTLHCQAEGHPTPRISWKRENREIFPFGSTFYSGDTLTITNAHRVDRGMYYCVAENDIEPKAEEGIRVNVEFAPIVTTPRPRVGQAKGYNAKLQCHVEGYPVANVTWLKNGREIRSVEVPVTTNDDYLHSHYVNLIGASDYGFYTCRVENKHGAAEAIVELYETEIPWIQSN